METAIMAIGDIHGNIRALDDLLNLVVPQLSSSDTLVFLGDYIDRGPNAKECVDRIIALKRTASFSVVTLMGNHEQWMLRTYRDYTAHSWIIGMEAFKTINSYSPTAVRTLLREMRDFGMEFYISKPKLSYHLFFDTLPTEHRRFFENLQLKYRADGVLCAHGGLNTKISIEAQDEEHFLWGDGGFPDRYSGTDHVVYGHRNNAVFNAGWPLPNVMENRTYGIDTIAHGVLTAIRFPGAEVFQSRKFN
jgi:Calcineurin-like phosphoesterase